MTPGFEDVCGAEITVALEQAIARRAHVRRIAAAFTLAEGWRDVRAYLGLARFIPAWSHVRDFRSPAFRADHGTPWLPAPWGWRYRCAEGYDARHLMPLWLSWLVAVWNLRWSLVRLAMRLDLWAVSTEGGYYVDGYSPLWLKVRHIAWCFVNDRDRYVTVEEGIAYLDQFLEREIAEYFVRYGYGTPDQVLAWSMKRMAERDGRQRTGDVAWSSLNDPATWSPTLSSAGSQLTLGKLKELQDSILNAPIHDSPAVPILSSSRWEKCRRGEHVLAFGICIHCWTDVRDV